MKIKRNTTSIVKFINNEIVKDEYKTNGYLNNHQYIIKTFFKNVEFDDTKGLLIYHNMGTGKTITSVSMAVDYEGGVIVFINTSLVTNFKENIKKYLNAIKMNDIDQYIKSKFTFISLNAFNLHEKIPDNLAGKLIIIDEAHHVFSGVVNGSKNQLKLYYSIRKEPDLKLILLTGTPITNDPYELMVAMNLLTGGSFFPESYDSYLNYFDEIKTDNEALFNKRIEKLENRIVGLVSYYEQPVSEDYPIDLGIEIVTCKMTNKQATKYVNFRKIEEDKAVNMMRRPRTTGNISKSNNISNYRIQTRMVCNSNPDEDVLICYKYNEIYKKIISCNGCAIVYSQFVNNYGLLGFSNFLIKKKYVKMNLNNVTDYSNSKQFTIIEGEIPFEDRQRILNVFKDPKNIRGDIVHIALVSSTGAEGLDFNFVKSVHIMEPYWNMSRLDQIKARAIRFKSHELLPKKERTVNTYVYLSQLNPEVLTTDEEIYEMCINKRDLINKYLRCLKKAAIDCSLNFDECITCNTTEDKWLYKQDFEIDIKFPNPCKEDQEEKKKLKHIKDDIYEDEKTKKRYKMIKGKLIEL